MARQDEYAHKYYPDSKADLFAVFIEKCNEMLLKNGFFAMITAKKYEIADDALDRLLDVAEYYRQRPNFANARTIRSIVDQVILNQNLRAEDNEGDYTIVVSDVDDYISDEGIDLSATAPRRRIGF